MWGREVRPLRGLGLPVTTLRAQPDWGRGVMAPAEPMGRVCVCVRAMKSSLWSTSSLKTTKQNNKAPGGSSG